MDAPDAALIARIQFAFTMSAHIIFPSFTIGLASYLAVLEGLWLWKRDPVYLSLFNYWKKIFAVAFGMGVVSGIVMSYQFGTNWSVFSDKAGPVLGPLMGYEVLTAFFLEAGFLGVMLFGQRKVGPGLHYFATLMVAFGTLLSTFWILSANSWMHTPTGFAMNDQGQFVPVSWFEVIFNPSFPYRLTHMVFAAYLTTALVVGGVGAWHLLKNPLRVEAQRMFSMAMWLVAIVAPLQIVAGDFHGLNTLKHQPAKIAAMEGHFEGGNGAGLVLFGYPDVKEGRTLYKVEVPRLGSLILTHSWDGYVPGLNDFAPQDRPNPIIPFFAFRVMVGLGFLMAALGFYSLWARRRGDFATSRPLHLFALVMSPAGFAAVLSGWFVTEVGRQPWIVQGLLRTVDARSPIDAAAVTASLAAFVMVYLVVFGAGTYYVLALMAKPPEPGEPDIPAGEPLRAAGITPVASVKAAEGAPPRPRDDGRPANPTEAGA